MVRALPQQLPSAKFTNMFSTTPISSLASMAGQRNKNNTIEPPIWTRVKPPKRGLIELIQAHTFGVPLPPHPPPWEHAGKKLLQAMATTRKWPNQAPRMGRQQEAIRHQGPNYGKENPTTNIYRKAPSTSSIATPASNAAGAGPGSGRAAMPIGDSQRALSERIRLRRG